MTWIASNWELLFGGVGTAVVVAILGFVLKKRQRTHEDKSVGVSQSIKAGDNSKVTQVGRDYTK